MKNKRQIFFIHGGESFREYNDYINYLKTRNISLDEWINWRDEYLDKKLGVGFDIIRPRFPNPDNAKYLEWKINFERYLPLLKSGVILIGASMGGVFLAKYLSEHKLSKKISAVFLIAPPYSNTLPGEYYDGGFNLKSDLSLIEENCKNVTLLFSEDDESVPVIHATKYAKKLSRVKIMIFKSKNGHFRIQEFPEIIKLIKEIK
jgi:predicted alpha/beta hydrolase family esterase